MQLHTDRLTGSDFDHCRDAQTGALAGWAADAVQALDSYTEVSPSGTGMRVYARGRKPGRRCKKGDVEIYDGLTSDGKQGGRVLTVTGHRLPGAPATINDRQQQIEALYRRTFGVSKLKAEARSAADLSDEALLAKAHAARDGAKFRRLFSLGDTSGYPSASEADLALLMLLGFWTAWDRGRMDRLFRSSALMRDKWTEKRGEKTYGERTLDAAFDRRGDSYTGNGQHGGKGEAQAGGGSPPPGAPGGDGARRQTGYQIIRTTLPRALPPALQARHHVVQRAARPRGEGVGGVLRPRD